MTQDTGQHIIIVGWDAFAKAVSTQLLAAGRRIVVITTSLVEKQEIRAFAPESQVSVLTAHREDFEALAAADVEGASNVFVNLTDDREKLIYIFKLRKAFPGCRIVAPVNNPNLKETFINAAAIHPLSKDEISAKMFASYLFERDVAAYTADLFSTAVSDDDYDIQQFRVTADNPWCGASYGETFKSLRRTINAVLIGIAKAPEPRTLLKNPPDETPVEEGDYLILILSGKASAMLEAQLGIVEGES